MEHLKAILTKAAVNKGFKCSIKHHIALIYRWKCEEYDFHRHMPLSFCVVDIDVIVDYHCLNVSSICSLMYKPNTPVRERTESACN